jgi:hypothetical protein
MRALPAALLAHRRPSLLAPVLAGAFASAALRRPPLSQDSGRPMRALPADSAAAFAVSMGA